MRRKAGINIRVLLAVLVLGFELAIAGMLWDAFNQPYGRLPEIAVLS